MLNPYLILGVHENSSNEEIKSKYNSLKDNLNEHNFHSELAKQQASRCITLIDVAFQILTDSSMKSQYDTQASLKNIVNKEIHPRLGQLCVVSSLITLDDLKEAVDIQIKTKKPIGEVLVEKQYISQSQLEGLLMGQDLIDVPASNPDPFAQRLIQLGLVSEDMVLIASVRQKAQNIDIGTVLVQQGWLDLEIFNALKNN